MLRYLIESVRLFFPEVTMSFCVVIPQLICLSDLQNDFINPHDCAKRVNRLIVRWLIVAQLSEQSRHEMLACLRVRVLMTFSLPTFRRSCRSTPKWRSTAFKLLSSS